MGWVDGHEQDAAGGSGQAGGLHERVRPGAGSEEHLEGAARSALGEGSAVNHRRYSSSATQGECPFSGMGSLLRHIGAAAVADRAEAKAQNAQWPWLSQRSPGAGICANPSEPCSACKVGKQCEGSDDEGETQKPALHSHVAQQQTIPVQKATTCAAASQPCAACRVGRQCEGSDDEGETQSKEKAKAGLMIRGLADLKGTLHVWRSLCRRILYRRGVRARIFPEQVLRNRSAKSFWLAANGEVFDVTTFLTRHPGGVEAILRNAGEDNSEDYELHSTRGQDTWRMHSIGELLPHGSFSDLF